MKAARDSDVFADWYLGMMLVVVLAAFGGGSWLLVRTAASLHEMPPSAIQTTLILPP